MARSFVAVTAGSGTKLATSNYTDGADSKHDEMVALGEQPLPGYLASQGTGGAAISTATAGSHLLQIMAGASLNVRIRRIEMWQAVAATAAIFGSIFIARLSTAGTGGTVQAVNNLNPVTAAAGATCMTLPTVKGTEAGLIYFASPYFMQTVGASTPMTAPMWVVDFDRFRSEPLIIGAGVTKGIAIKCNAAIAGASVWINVWLDESPY